LPNCIHNVYVDIVGKLLLQEFWTKHKRAKSPLEKWIQTVEAATWRNFAQVRQTYGTADLFRRYGRTFVIFNIGGNKYRLVTAINYQGQIVVIEVALTHKEYDKNKWKKSL